MTMFEKGVAKKKRGVIKPGPVTTATISKAILIETFGFTERTIKEYFRRNNEKLSNINDVASFIKREKEKISD